MRYVFSSFVFVLAGCVDPEVDAFRYQGGTAPDPTGVIEGSVVYLGPRPTCERDAAGTPTGIIGRAVLLLFDYDNPPPPSGSATSARNFLTVPGRDFFGDLARDCLPAEPTPEERSAVVMRSAPFVWPDIELANDAARAYQIRGFFDYDEDFNPFFGARNLPTKGDIAGGAVNNSAASPATFFRIEFGSRAMRPNGEVVAGVTVTLGARVMTERPIFYLDSMTQPLSSEATLPRTTDGAMREAILFSQTTATIRLYRGDAAADPDGDGPRVSREESLARAGVGLDPDPSGYAWFIDEVDANADGMADMHPILGRAGVPWLTPIIIFRREKIYDGNDTEVRAGIPDVLLIATIRPTAVPFGPVHVFPEAVQVVAPPVAAVALTSSAVCRVPFISPDTYAETYETSAVDCQEVPTGHYAVNVIHGNAGGAVMPGPVSETGTDLVGGILSGQAWTIPNQLGDWRQLGRTEAEGMPFVMPEQGNDGRFLVYDPNPGTLISRRSSAPVCLATGDMTPTGTSRPIAYLPLSEQQVELDCCASVRHLCDVPVCAPVEVDYRGMPRAIRRSSRIVRTDAAGKEIPDCVPFEMPAVCCPNPSPTPG